MQGTLFKLLAVALRVDLQWTYCCLKQSMGVSLEKNIFNDRTAQSVVWFDFFYSCEQRT